MRKKIAILACALLMAATIMPANTSSVIAKTTNVVAQNDTVPTGYKTWFKDQLNDFGKKFYNALETMYKDGRLKTGVGEIDLTTIFDQADLKAYASGNADIAKAFQAGRDAFHHDYPEIFYVDFAKITLRLGMQNGKYILSLSNGTNKDYFAYGFTSTKQIDDAIAEVTAVKEEVKKVVTDDIKNNAVNVVTAVHNKLVEMLDYTYPTGNDNTVSTVYGALKMRKANCDGYTRTFKWILDDFNIPTVYVGGVAKNARYEDKDDVANTMGEAHAWNYVQIDGVWYAVDVTWDDPIKLSAPKAATSIRTTYLLRGLDMMNENHFPMGQFSPDGYEFKYPDVSKIDYDKSITKDEVENFDDTSTDLKVRLEKVEEGGTDEAGNPKRSTIFRLNYLNKTMDELNAEGYYLAFRGTDEDGNTGKWHPANALPNAATGKDVFAWRISQPFVYQFCITKENTDDIVYSTDLAEPGKNIVITKQVKVPYYSKYSAPPYVRTANPPLTESILPEKKDYRIEFDQELVKIDAAKDISISVDNTADHIDYKVENVKMSYGTYTLPDGFEKKSTIITFSFTPDSTYQGYANTYTLQVENLKGINSNKKPNTFPIITSYTPIFPCPIAVANGAIPYTFVMSNPTLIVDQNLGNIFEAGDKDFGNLNIALVATTKSGKEKIDLDNQLNDEQGIDMSGEKVISSTYELSLGCGALAAAIRPGYKVSVGVPYPKGFHPLDYPDGVEFRAYHFKKQADGTYKTIEILCQITPSGLLISTDDFSPFTIVAMPSNDPSIPASKVKEKAVSASLETGGGKIETTKGGAGLFTLSENESRTFTVKPESGYIIERIMLNDKEVKLDNNKEFKTTFDYSTMAESNKLQAFFVAETVVKKEEEKKIDPIVPIVVDDKVLAPVIVYTDRTLTSKTNVGDIDYSVKGSMIQDLDLTVSMTKLDAAAEAAFKKYNTFVDAPIAAGVPALSKANAVDGEMTLKINVGSSYDGKTLTYLTYVNGAVKNTGIEVKDGMITIENVTALQPFYVINEEVKMDNINDLIQQCKEIKEADFTKTSYKTFKTMLENVVSRIDSGEKLDAEEVKNLYSGLKKVYDELVNVTLLKQAISEYELLKYNEYTTESFAPLKAASVKAQRALIDGTSVEITQIINDMTSAKGNLVAKNINTAKSLLNATITKAEAAKTTPGYDKVLPIYKTNLDNKLKSAKDVALKYENTKVDDANKTILAELQKANSELQDAMQYLSFTADKTALETMYNTYKVLDLTLYKDDANKDAFVAALDYAKYVIDKGNALDEMIELASTNLELAKNNLMPKDDPDADLTFLNAVKAKAEAIMKDSVKYDMKNASWAAFTAAYDAAKKVDPKDEAAVDKVASDLNAAIADLRFIPNQAVADQMTAMVSKINALDLSLYSEEDQIYLLQARLKAERFGKESYTQEELDEIITIMAKAQQVITDNVQKPTEPGKPDPKPEDPTTPPTNPVNPPEEPGNTPESPKDPVKTPESPVNGAIEPSTGDTTNLPLAAGLVAGAGMIGFIAYRKKRNKASK